MDCQAADAWCWGFESGDAVVLRRLEMGIEFLRDFNNTLMKHIGIHA